MRSTITALTASIILAATAHAADSVEAIRPSLVQVEYTLQYDSGQAPATAGWAERCPSCGRYHVQPGDTYVQEERPAEAAGYLIAPDRVLTADFFLQDRFIKSIQVRFGEEVVDARPVAYASDQYAMLLELDEPLPGAEPLSFEAEPEPPFRTAHWQLTDAEWTLQLKPLSLEETILTADGSERRVPVPARGLIIDGEANPVGIAMNETLPADDSWRGSPEAWQWISREELETRTAELEADAAHALPRVQLKFRRGRSRAGGDQYWDDEDDESVTERHALGVLVDEDTMLVLASLDARLTARLEQIVVHLPDGPLDAEFVGSFRDYGALVVRLSEPQSPKIRLDHEPIVRLDQSLLVSGEIELHGRNRVSRFGHTRIAGYDFGWRRHVYPSVPGDTENLFLFEMDGTLIALPVLRRKPADEETYYAREYPTLTAAAQIGDLFDHLDKELDRVNVPLSEEEELRIAWLGVELQPLDEELARMYEVSEITEDGSSGGLVSYVYPQSPAARAGLMSGDLLLRIYSDRRPRPLDVMAEEDPFEMWGGFPWDHYDEMPEEYFDQISPPWPSADNAVNRALTELGFDTTAELEVHRDGETQTLEITVVQGPPHHDAAPRHEDEPIGLTLSDLTYEVRRYFQKEMDDPGLVISRIETGSRASVAGLKPYEIITHINDEPLQTVEDFERLLEEHTDLRLNVERMHRTRIVRLNRPQDEDAETEGESVAEEPLPVEEPQAVGGELEPTP